MLVVEMRASGVVVAYDSAERPVHDRKLPDDSQLRFMGVVAQNSSE